MTNSPFLNQLKFNKPELACEPNWASHSIAIESFLAFRKTLDLALDQQLETLSKLDTQHDAELSLAQEQIGWLDDELTKTKEKLEKEKALNQSLTQELSRTKAELAHTILVRKSTSADLDSAWQTQMEMQEILIAQHKELQALRPDPKS